MDLQLALLLIGSIIVAIVALTAYDKGRIARSLRGGLRLPARGQGPAGAPVRREPVVPGGPAPLPPALDTEPRFLKPEPAVASVDEITKENTADFVVGSDPLTEELESLEEVATRPLNLNPGFDPPGTGPEAAGKAQTVPDERLDFVIHLPGPGPVTRRVALGVYKQNEYRLDWPRDLFGLRHQTNFWSAVQLDSDATSYSDLKLSLQLYDPARGPVHETELNTFVQVGLKLADALHRPSKFSVPFEQALERARALKQFCDEYDVIAGVNIVNDTEPFKGRAIAAAASRAGLTFGPLNIFHRRVDGRPLFSLSNLYKPGTFNPEDWDGFRTSGLTLFMSVPCASSPVAAFGEMVEVGRTVATFLGGKLLDQDSRPLTDRGIAAIRQQVQGIETKMRAFGVAPGSEAALRLFGTSLG